MAYNFKRVEAWRSHPLLSNTMRHSMPGFLLGLGAFAVYVAFDQATKAGKPKAGH